MIYSTIPGSASNSEQIMLAIFLTIILTFLTIGIIYSVLYFRGMLKIRFGHKNVKAIPLETPAKTKTTPTASRKPSATAKPTTSAKTSKPVSKKTSINPPSKSKVTTQKTTKNGQ